MAIKITWADFDKTLFVTPKNIRKLMGFSITFGDEQEQLENRVNAQDEKLETAGQEAHDAVLLATAAQQSADRANAKIDYDISVALANLDRRVSALEGG